MPSYLFNKALLKKNKGSMLNEFYNTWLYNVNMGSIINVCGAEQEIQYLNI